MKRHILNAARISGLLRPADRLMLLRARMRAFGRNRRFRRANPGIPMPPDDLAFDAYHHVDRTLYHDGGRLHAGIFAQAIGEALPQRELDILEWGCGPGRLIRHIAPALPGRVVRLTGTDVNARSIAWCSRHLPGITFLPNGFSPPLPFADASFDAVYSYSVFTHLSEAAQTAWAAELFRVLRPGGVVVCTTQGDCFRDRLAVGEEVGRYATEGLVVQGGYEEGKKWFLALNSPEHVRTRLLAAFEDIRQIPPAPGAAMQQDVWIARKPAA